MFCMKAWGFFCASVLSVCVLADDTANDVAYWTSPRAALLGEGIYINGGDLFLGNSSMPMRSDVLAGGALYRLELGLPQPATSDLSNFEYLTYPRDPARVPFFVAGAMFATYSSLSTFGGLPSRDASNDGMYFFNLTGSDPSPTFSNGSVSKPQPPISQDSRMWHRCCGADVSVPDQNLAFYFGGLTASNGGLISYQTSDGDTDQANTSSNSLIMCNVANADQPSCERMPTSNIEPRVEAELVWVPYGAQGSLLVLGGISLPSDMMVSGLMPTYDDSTGFNDWMTDIAIFDIASRTWMTQKTIGTGPGQRASFCSIVTTSQGDKNVKSHHVYIYGGYDGTYLSTNETAVAFDDVWVLSLPSFQWTLVAPGTPEHRRQNHKCIKTSPNQFWTVGGNIEWGQALNTTFMDVFDMNKLTWNASYEPSTWSDYIIPDVLKKDVKDLNAIPSGLADNVKQLLGTPYKGSLREWRSYPKPDSRIHKGHRRTPRWFATTIGILTYLTFATAALIIMVALRRRMIFRSARLDTSRVVRSKSYVVRWLHNANVKEPVSPEVTMISPDAEPFDGPFTDSVIIEEGSSSKATSPILDKGKGKGKGKEIEVTVYERANVRSDSDSDFDKRETAYERVNVGGEHEIELNRFPETMFKDFR